MYLFRRVNGFCPYRSECKNVRNNSRRVVSVSDKEVMTAVFLQWTCVTYVVLGIAMRKIKLYKLLKQISSRWCVTVWAPPWNEHLSWATSNSRGCGKMLSVPVFWTARRPRWALVWAERCSGSVRCHRPCRESAKTSCPWRIWLLQRRWRAAHTKTEQTCSLLASYAAASLVRFVEI